MKNLISESYEARKLLRTYEYLDKEEFLKNLSEELKKDTFFMGEVDKFFEKDLKLQILKSKCASEYNSDTDIENVDSVHFGSYPQSDVNGEKKEPIEWIVLEKNNDEAILVSKYILDYKPFGVSSNWLDDSWFDSELEKWLHKEFLFNAFARNEIDQIVEMEVPYQGVHVSDDFEDETGTGYGQQVQRHDITDFETKNKITLIGLKDCKKYFNLNTLATKTTGYAKEVQTTLKNEKSRENQYYLRDLDVEEQELVGNGFDGTIGLEVAKVYVDENGNVKGETTEDSFGVRPMIKVSLNYVGII